MTETALIPFLQESETEQIAMLEAEIARRREKVADSLAAAQTSAPRDQWRHWVGLIRSPGSAPGSAWGSSSGAERGVLSRREVVHRCPTSG